MRQNKSQQVIVVGGGPAGMMAALAAAAGGAAVTLLERNDQLGRKMMLTGGGRCNLSNDTSPDVFISRLPGNGKFLFSALNAMPPQRLRQFLDSLGLPTVAEEGGRVFPASGQAGDVVRTLAGALVAGGVRLHLATRVKGLVVEAGCCRGVVSGDGIIYAPAVIVATGGLSYPATGSSGDGYLLARRAGHRIIDLRPSLLPLESSETWIRDRSVQGLALKGVGLTLYTGPERRKVKALQGDVIFTHFGLSGPGILCLSRHLAGSAGRPGKQLAGALATGVQPEGEAQAVPGGDEEGVKVDAPDWDDRAVAGEAGGPWLVAIDLFPQLNEEKLLARLLSLAAASPARSVKNLLAELLPGRLLPVILFRAGVDPGARSGSLSRKAWRKVTAVLRGLPVSISGTRPLKEATITAGGVDVKEVDPRTMASRLVTGLYFAGEVLDVDGYTGGYNIHIAFATGWLAGKTAAAGVCQ